MSKTESLEKLVAAIPGEDGWWKSHAEDTYQDAARKLTESGFSDEEAVEFLTELYCAAAECFGD